MSNRTEGMGVPINIVTRIWPDAGGGFSRLWLHPWVSLPPVDFRGRRAKGRERGVMVITNMPQTLGLSSEKVSSLYQHVCIYIVLIPA